MPQTEKTNTNTDDSNIGYCNKGSRNTGNCNTGNSNTGHWNTGDYNTGNSNATNNSTGIFCIEPQTIKSFDVETGLTLEEFLNKYPQSNELTRKLVLDDDIDFAKYASIPGITPDKLKALHNKHLATG